MWETSLTDRRRLRRACASKHNTAARWRLLIPSSSWTEEQQRGAEMVTSHACTWTRRTGRNLMSETDRQQLFFQLRNKLQPLWTAPVISSYVVLLHCNDVKEWSLWNLIKQFVTLSKQTSDSFFFFSIVLCSGLEENRNWLRSLRWFRAQIAKSGCSEREREGAAQRRLITAWPGKAAQHFFPRPAVSRWKPAVFFFKDGNQKETRVELLTALSFQPLTLMCHWGPRWSGWSRAVALQLWWVTHRVRRGSCLCSSCGRPCCAGCGWTRGSCWPPSCVGPGRSPWSGPGLSVCPPRCWHDPAARCEEGMRVSDVQVGHNKCT